MTNVSKLLQAASLLLIGFGTLSLAPSVKAQTLFAGNLSDNRIETYNAATGALINSSFITGISPFNLTVDLSTNSLYVADNNTGYSYAYNATTGASLTGFTPVPPLFPFALSYSIAVQNGVLYRLGFGQVSSFNASTGSTINSDLTRTEGSSIAASGNTIFTSGAQVNAFSGSTGALIATLVTPGDVYPTSFGNSGAGIVVNGSVFYVANTPTNTVVSANATTGSINNLSLFYTPSIYRVATYNGVFFTVSSSGGSGNKIFAFDMTSGNALSGFTPVSSSNFYAGIAIIPEPSTYAMVAIGLGVIGIGFLRRRQAQA